MDYFSFSRNFHWICRVAVIPDFCRTHFSCATFSCIQKGFAFIGTYARNMVSGYSTSIHVRASGNALRVTAGAFPLVIFSRITQTVVVHIGDSLV
jgi:hypothetical protein